MRYIFLFMISVFIFSCAMTKQDFQIDGCLFQTNHEVLTDKHILLSRLSAQASKSLAIKLKRSYVSLDGERLKKIPVNFSYDLSNDYVGSWLSGFYENDNFIVSAPCNNIKGADLIFVTLKKSSTKWRVIALNAKNEILFVLEEPLR